MGAEALASYMVVAVIGIAIGGAKKYALGRVFLWLLVALIGAGLFGYFLGTDGASHGSVPFWVGPAGLFMVPTGLLMAVFALPKAGFERIFPPRRGRDE